MAIIKERFQLTEEIVKKISEWFRDQDNPEKWSEDIFGNITKPSVFYTKKNISDKNLNLIKSLIKEGYLTQLQRQTATKAGKSQKVPNHWQIFRTEKYLSQSKSIRRNEQQ